MFEGDSAGMCTGKFSLIPMRGRADGPECADPVVRTPIGMSGNFHIFISSQHCSLSYIGSRFLLSIIFGGF
jgi:hypothetical protein